MSLEYILVYLDNKVHDNMHLLSDLEMDCDLFTQEEDQID